MRNFILVIVGIVFGTIVHAEILIGFGAPALDGGQRAIMNGFVSKAEEKGWEVVVSNANSDAQQQANQLDNFIAQGVDAIVTVPVDSKAVCSSVERAQDDVILFNTFIVIIPFYAWTPAFIPSFDYLYTLDDISRKVSVI